MADSNYYVQIAEEIIVSIRSYFPVHAIRYADIVAGFSKKYPEKDVELVVRKLILHGMLRQMMLGLCIGDNLKPDTDLHHLFERTLSRISTQSPPPQKEIKQSAAIWTP